MFGVGVEGIVKQFQTDLKTYIPPNMSHTAFDKNMEKNRYKGYFILILIQKKIPVLPFNL